MAYTATDTGREAEAFLGALFGHLEQGLVVISQPRAAEGDGGGLVTDYASLEELAAATRLYNASRSTWVGAATRRRAMPSYERGGKAECLEVAALWADLDVYDPEAHAKEDLPLSVEAARYLLGLHPMAPSVVVDSGHGLQAWWLLDEPMPATTYEAHWRRRWSWSWRDTVDRLNAIIVPQGRQPIGRLDSVWSVDRIMRLPGTMNTKVPGKAVPVRLVELEEGRRYSVGELEEALPEPPDERPGIWQPQASVRAVGLGLAGDDYNARHTAAESLERAGFTPERDGRLWTRPGKDARQGHSAEVFPDGFARVYSSTVHKAFPAMADELGDPVNLSPFALEAVLRYPRDTLEDACRSFAEDLEAMGYGTPAGERAGAIQDAIRSLVPATTAQRAHLALVPTEGPPQAVVAAEEADPGPRSSWRRINLLDVRREPDELRPRPSVLAITGLDSGMLYPTKLHLVVGESEAGKTWLTLVAAREVVRGGGQVLFVDFEDDERSVEERLSDLKVTDEELGRFAYFRPDGPLFTLGRNGQPLPTEDMAVFRDELEALGGVELVIFDGFNEALGLHGLSMNQATEVAVMFNTIMKPLARHLGAAMVVIDHLAKDKDSRLLGHAIGSQHKRAACDVMLSVYKVRPFARGGDGLSKVRVTKDRPGRLRALCEDEHRSELAEFRLSSSASETAASITKAVPLDPMDLTNPRLDAVHHWVLGHPGCSGKEVEDNVTGKASELREALSTLEQLGHINKRKRPGRGGGWGYWAGDRDRDDMGNLVPSLDEDGDEVG